MRKCACTHAHTHTHTHTTHTKPYLAFNSTRFVSTGVLTAAARKKKKVCAFFFLTLHVFVCKTYFFVGCWADVQVWDASGQKEVPLLRS